MKKIFFSIALTLCTMTAAAQEPLSTYDLNKPFGWATVDGTVTGGEGGQEIVATTADELFNALDIRDPNDRSKRNAKVIVYVKGSIEVPQVKILHVQNKTIIGLPGARLYSKNTNKSNGGIMKFSEDCENIIIRNLIFEGPGSYDVDGGDALAFQGSQRIWIDHCDIHDGLDGNLDCTNGSNYVTISWTRFSYQKEPMSGGSGGANDHRFSNLWGSSDKKADVDTGKLNTTFANCWWDEGCIERCPRVRFGKVHIVNCYYSNTGNHYSLGYGYKSNIYAENCWFNDGVIVSKDYSDANHGYADYNFQVVGCHNSQDIKKSVGNDPYYTPSDYYSYTPFDVDLVPTVVGNEKTGAGANLMVEVGKGVTGYADGSVVPEPEPEPEPDPDVTGIAHHSATQHPHCEGAKSYTLTGQKASSNFKGIVVKDGKKLVK